MTWAVKQYTVKPGSNRSLTLCLSRGRDEPRAPGYDNWCACVTSSFTALVCKLYGLLFLTVRSVGMVDPHLPSAKVSAGAEQRTSDRRDNISHTYEVRRESQAMIERITYDVYALWTDSGPHIAETSPRGHPDIRRGRLNPSHAGEARWNPNCLAQKQKK